MSCWGGIADAAMAFCDRLALQVFEGMKKIFPLVVVRGAAYRTSTRSMGCAARHSRFVLHAVPSLATNTTTRRTASISRLCNAAGILIEAARGGARIKKLLPDGMLEICYIGHGWNSLLDGNPQNLLGADPCVCG
jgi:hypothetical protein